MPTYKDAESTLTDFQTAESDSSDQLVEKSAKKPKRKYKPHPAHAETIRKSRAWEKSPHVNGYKDAPGQRAKIALAMLEFDSWGKPDRGDINALEERFKQYIQYCIENDMIVSNLTAYYALGIDKVTVHEWFVGKKRTKEHTEFIKKVKAICASYREMAGAEGLLQPVTMIWWQKNFDGFTDNQTITIQPGNPLGDEVDPAELKRRIEGNVPVEDFEVLD